MQEENSKRLRSLVSFLRSLAAPWFATGSCNATPAEVAVWTAIRYLKARMVIPDAPFTCRSPEGSASRLIDFAICSAPLFGSISLSLSWGVPFNPHAGLCITVHFDSMLEDTADLLIVPESIPLCAGPRWNDCQARVLAGQALPLDLSTFDGQVGLPADDLSKQYATFSAAVCGALSDADMGA